MKVFQVPAAKSQAPSLFGQEETQEVVNVAEEKPSDKKAVQAASSPVEASKSKKPAGAVSLFGGINVQRDEAKSTPVRMKTVLLPFRYLMLKLTFGELKPMCLCYRNTTRMHWRTLMILTGIKKSHHLWRPKRKRPRKARLVCLMMMMMKRNPMRDRLFPQQPSIWTKVH